MSVNYFEEKKIVNVFDRFIAILCAKILCVTWALERKVSATCQDLGSIINKRKEIDDVKKSTKQRKQLSFCKN